MSCHHNKWDGAGLIDKAGELPTSTLQLWSGHNSECKTPNLGQFRLPTQGKATVTEILAQKPWRSSRPTTGLQHGRQEPSQLCILVDVQDNVRDPTSPWNVIAFHRRAHTIPTHWSCSVQSCSPPNVYGPKGEDAKVLQRLQTKIDTILKSKLV